MANKYYNDTTASGPKGGKVNMDSHAPVSVTEKKIKWAGLPGKTQSKDRSRGVKKVKTRVVSEGI